MQCMNMPQLPLSLTALTLVTYYYIYHLWDYVTYLLTYLGKSLILEHRPLTTVLWTSV